ncbi:MAG: hypothetical protein ISR06_04215 [Synechococcus sp. BS30m-G30]|nr:hypothetical protein [Synechococcus sp. BS30m-G30]
MWRSRIVHERAGRSGSRSLGLHSFGVEASCLSWVCSVIEVGDFQHETATGLVCRGRGYCLNNGVPFLKSF